jgi:hypothetical protein
MKWNSSGDRVTRLWAGQQQKKSGYNSWQKQEIHCSP